MRLDERKLEGTNFKRRKATADTKRKVEHWEVWECHDTAFAHDYHRAVTLYVNEGGAELTFGDGETVEIEKGDTLTIHKGARATWTIQPPIRNRYCYHDTFSSAESRAEQVHWRGKSF